MKEEINVTNNEEMGQEGNNSGEPCAESNTDSVEESGFHYERVYTSDDLHGAVKVILWLSIVFTGISLVGTVFSSNSNSVISPIWLIADVLLGVASIYGAYQILQTQKEGYSIMVTTRLLIIVLTYFEVQDLLNHSDARMDMYVRRVASDAFTRSVLVNLGQILFLSLLLMLRKNGKSGFDVLWRRK